MLFRPNSIPLMRLSITLLALILSGVIQVRAQLSPVIYAERQNAVQNMNADPVQVKQMLNEALLKLTSAQDIGTAWTRLGITPQDVVGIKISTVGGPGLCTHHSLVHAICDGLAAAGVPRTQMIIWDKYQNRMTPAGYGLRDASNTHAGIASIIPSNYYDPNVFYKNYLVGSLIWGDYRFLQPVSYNDSNSGNVNDLSYYTKFVTQKCTKIINVPNLSDDPSVGMHGCLSSLALSSVDNNRRFRGAPTYGDPAICEILNQDFFRRKVVIHILDAFLTQCAGGPKFNPIFCEGVGVLYVSRDPVAIDSLALGMLERMRKQMNVPPIGNAASYIASAPSYNLGTNDRRRIQFIRVP
jgi:hypothetical protein